MSVIVFGKNEQHLCLFWLSHSETSKPPHLTIPCPNRRRNTQVCPGGMLTLCPVTQLPGELVLPAYSHPPPPPWPDAHSGVTALSHRDAPVSHPTLCSLPTCCLPMCVLSQVWLCDPGAWSPPGCCVHRILQASILEWVAISFSRGSSQPRESNSCLLHCRQVLLSGTIWEVPGTKGQDFNF